MSNYTYDELVQFHEEMTQRLSGLTAEGLLEFHVNRLRGVVEVLVSRQHDHADLNDLVAGIPSDAYEVVETAESTANSMVSPARPHRRFLGGFSRILRRRRR
jgi:hypothetical protein